jgi:arsenate reductase
MENARGAFMPKIRVLFVCIHNSARSQMAEALMNHLYGDVFEAESAGLEPGVLNPLAVAAMKDIGIDISQKETRDVFELQRKKRTFHYVVTVCDGASGERCPVFPGASKRLHWEFEDPSSFTGSLEEKLGKTIGVREKINDTIRAWVDEIRP